MNKAEQVIQEVKLGFDPESIKSEFGKLFDDINAGRYPWRFIYWCQDAGCSQEYIDYRIRDSYEWVSEQPGYNLIRRW